ncbi:hypothetical protein [Parapedobacter koreensis]|uniref:hypothetical protein n=1 Tax=Parapedobacter koreensis TaxID=332977 RepID=UPI00115FFF6F|nr:hypothetical protein [Parapedobacter koreensis]
MTFIDTVRVEIVAGKLKLNPLLIKETGLQAGIDSLIIAVPYFKKANTSATLTVTNPHRIPAGSVIGVTYDVPDEFKKDLPLGVTVGSFELFSPEMKEQLVVPIKIVKKRGGFCLLFCLFSGLLLGWVVRHYLQNKKDSEESKLSALALLEKMTQEKDRVKDGKFRTEVAKLINDLDTKLQKHTFFADMLKSTNTLENEMNSTLQQFEACKSDFEQRIAGAKKEWMEISSCFESVGYAPFIKEKLAEAENDYHSAKANLEEGDSENAKANIKNATNRMKGFLSEFAGKLDGLVLAIEEYDVYPQINPDPIKDSISPAMQGIKADLTQLLTVETPVSIGVALADKIKRNFDNILQLIKRRLTKRFYELEIESGGSGSWQSFYQSFEAWKQSIDGILRDPYREMDSNVLVTLAKHWSVFEQEPKVALLDGTMTGVDMEVLTVYEHDPLPVGIQFTGQIPGIAPVSVRLHQARKHWLVYSLVQTFLLWFVLALIAFKFYAPDFIGKTDELIVIFLFAFGVDITVDNVMQLRDKIKFP